METGSYINQPPEVVEHERTYKAFSVLMRWAMVILGDAILTLTLLFATHVGWLGALFTGAVAFVLGYIFVVHHEETQPLDVWAEGR